MFEYHCEGCGTARIVNCTFKVQYVYKERDGKICPFLFSGNFMTEQEFLSNPEKEIQRLKDFIVLLSEGPN